MPKIISISLLIITLLLVVLTFFHPTLAINEDLGRHILTGKIIYSTHKVPNTNLFSYTNTNYPFIDHHWLSQVIFYLLHSVSGFNGLSVFTIVIFLCSFFTPFLLYLYKKADIFSFCVVILIYLQIAVQRTDVRPEVFSYLFLSLMVTILYMYRTRYTKLIYLIPIVELCWVNIHIYFPLGAVVCGLFLFDAIVSKRYIGLKKEFLTLSFVCVATCVVTLLNPNGLTGALYPLNVFQNYGYEITENKNIFYLWNIFLSFHKTTIIFFVLSAIVLLILWLIQWRKLLLVDLLIILFFAIFGVIALRNITLFVYATLIPATVIMSSTFAYFYKWKYFTTFSYSLVFILIFFQSFSILNTQKMGLGVINGPQRGVDFFIGNKLHGPIFNNFDIGSYLEYRLYPQEQVFVDGRPEAYPVSFFQKTYIPMQQNKLVFNNVSKQYHFDSIFFVHTDQTPWAQTFLAELSQNPAWALVYLDDYVVIYSRRTSENKQFIEKHLIQQATFETPDAITHDYDSLIRMAGYYSKAGWEKQEEDAYRRILSIKPYFCPVLYNLIIILAKRNDPTINYYLINHRNHCPQS